MCSQDYYFISTSSPDDVLSRRGGFCTSHNMKVMFKVLESSPDLPEEHRGQEEPASSVMFSLSCKSSSLRSVIIVMCLLALLHSELSD